jgi:hypothetical protein
MVIVNSLPVYCDKRFLSLFPGPIATTDAPVLHLQDGVALSIASSQEIPSIVTGVDTSICDANPSKSAIPLVPLAKCFDAAA